VAELDAAMDQVIGLFTTPGAIDQGAGGNGRGTAIVAFRTEQDLDALLPVLRRLANGSAG
jgi:hypothetical protein